MAGKKYGTISLALRGGVLQCAHCSQRQRDVLDAQRVIYIYYGRKSFYVGQTDQFLTRHTQHMKETRTNYRQFDHVIVLFGQYVDGNSQNDLERLLITYLITDNEPLAAAEKRRCRNGTLGNRSADYSYRAEVLSQVLTPFWEHELHDAGLVHETSLEGLRKSILFKYSPFTELSAEQCALIQEIQDGGGSFLVEGTVGTGKTVVLTNLAAGLCTCGQGRPLEVGVAVKSNWVRLARRIFRAYGLGGNITVGTAYQLIRRGKRFDIILVDEAHRLRWNSPKQNHLTTGIFDPDAPEKNELFLLGQLADRLVLFYDPLQAIRPSDIPYRDFQGYVDRNGFQRRRLTKQFRIQAAGRDGAYTSDDYVNGVCAFLQLSSAPFNAGVFRDPSEDAYFGIVGSIHELFDYVNEQRQYHPKAQCRVLAGYARPWNSHRRPGSRQYADFDWIEDADHRWRWNSTHESWIDLPGSEDEIGSVHAVQGVDLDYVGVVIAGDLTVWDGAVTAVKGNYYDQNGTPPRESFSPEELSEYIRHVYYVLLTRGISGIRVCFEDPALERHFRKVVDAV